jgi:hypothetical protein
MLLIFHCKESFKFAVFIALIFKTFFPSFLFEHFPTNYPWTVLFQQFMHIFVFYHSTHNVILTTHVTIICTPASPDSFISSLLPLWIYIWWGFIFMMPFICVIFTILWVFLRNANVFTSILIVSVQLNFSDLSNVSKANFLYFPNLVSHTDSTEVIFASLMLVTAFDDYIYLMPCIFYCWSFHFRLGQIFLIIKIFHWNYHCCALLFSMINIAA